MWKITILIFHSRPPDGCLQYQTGLTGKIKTFNFDYGTEKEQHLKSQKYTHCIRSEKGYCCVRYQVCSDPDSFSIQRSTNTNRKNKAAVDVNCGSETVVIEGKLITYYFVLCTEENTINNNYLFYFISFWRSMYTCQ